MKINYKYIVAFIILLIIEVLIALFVRDTIIRPFVGDVLVILVLYTFIKSFINKEIKYLSIYIFAFATAVEVSQYFNLVDRLNLSNNKILSIALGSTFDIKDILCYLVGAIILMLFEKYFKIESVIE